jgi:peptidyl-prolyl cis-trans isomerase SurA
VPGIRFSIVYVDQIRVMMTLRISQVAVVCGLGWLALPGVVLAQAPRYQSPLSMPNAPQQQVTLPVTPAITPNGTVVEDVVAHVNDLIISRSDVQRAEEALAQENQQSNATPAEAAERQKNLLRDMIDKQLLLSRGKELGMSADAEVVRQLDEIRKQNHLDTMEDLEKAARQSGVSFEDFKASIRDRVITQMVVRDEVGRRMQQPTQAQEQAYYETHKQEFQQPEQIKLSEILVPTAADSNDAAVAQAQAKADGIVTKLKAGGNFEELAKADSGGPTAAQGGELGMYKRGTLGQVLEDQTFNLKAGEWTAPIRTKQGFVILKVTEHQAAGAAPLKDVESQVQEGMYTEQMQPKLREYLTKLREDAYIEVRPGYVDSGASPRQTKPVFTAYAPPPVKKKTAQQKKRFDRGTKYSAAAKTGKTPVATPVSAVTTSAATTATSTTPTTKKATAPAKPKKIKREKIRYGQAPRNSLPAGPEETASGSDVGAGAASAVTPGTAMASAAPGTALENSGSSDTGANPLEEKAAPTGKTRYSARAKEVTAEKKVAKVKKTQEKIAAGPIAASPEEKATEKVQAAPLGLNGDTSKKKKKQPKDKNAPKERLQNQAAKPPAPAPQETPSKSPDRGTPQEGILPPAPKPPDSTAPPATTPNTPPTAPQTTPQQ